MQLNRSYRYLILVIMLVPAGLRGQDVNYDSLLQRVDTVENPVYKPVISISYGVLNFLGDVRNPLLTPVTGNMAGMVNVATYIDRKNQYFVANFNFMAGRFSVNHYDHTDLQRNLNFESDIYSFGFNLEYRFGHLMRSNPFLRPYVSVGVDNINFSSRGDLVDTEGVAYNYWSDGRIMSQPETTPAGAVPLYRDYEYETYLRSREIEGGFGDYNQRSMAVPLGAGIHMSVNPRVFLSLGMVYRYTFTDFIDNVAFEGTSIAGEKGNDAYIFSHASLHFDLFSDPSTRTVDLLFAEVDFDPLFYDDEDGDFVLDLSDRCPGTPYGVAVDSLGCPLDGDGDLVPDYLDKEPDTPAGAWVDEDGHSLSEEAFYSRLSLRESAMDRSEVEQYLESIQGSYTPGSSREIPERFRTLDEDGDNYISFDELLRTVDKYFDYELELSIEEVRELNDFFFSQ